MSRPIFFVGHSLAAARAHLGTFSRIERGLRVDGVYAFAPPNPGDRKIGAAYATRPGLIAVSVKNRRDLVTDVPVDIALLGEEYVQPVPFTEINQPAPLGDPWGIFSDHHMVLYAAGARRLPQGTAVLGPGEAAELADAIYVPASAGYWAWEHFVDGAYWAAKITSQGALAVVGRGSKTGRDWLDDFDATQTTVHGARVSSGFWCGVPEDAIDQAVAQFG